MQDPADINLDDDGGEPGEEPEAYPTRSHVIDMGKVSPAWKDMTVTIRPFLSYAADQRITSAAIASRKSPRNRRERRQDAGSVIGWVPDGLGHAVAVVEEAVLEWTLVGADGRPLPANRSGVVSPQAPAVLLNAAIDEVMDYYEAQQPDPTRT